MKATKALFKALLIVNFFSFTLQGYSQDTPGHATARIFESSAKGLSRIVLVYENGESEVIPLNNWKFLGTAGSNNKLLIENQVTINKMINDMSQKGYEVSKMTASGESIFYTLILFSKKE